MNSPRYSCAKKGVGGNRVSLVEESSVSAENRVVLTYNRSLLCTPYALDWGYYENRFYLIYFVRYKRNNMTAQQKKEATAKTDEPHVALYRKYRPGAFDAVRGQDHIVVALQGALKKNTMPHALLFAGTRGTGKTSIARIVAREVGASSVDTYEIDAASNRGIDDIRELKEAVHTLPFESPKKVYIIDEVHMLTKEAFNALLKTLEEPPAHAMFILATTEVEKLPDTIVSRCQVFQFKAPTLAILRDAILHAAEGEQFTLSNDAADLVALAADGSFRDALSITEKVMMASPDAKATADEVSVILGAPKKELLLAVLQSIHTKSPEGALSALNSALDANLDMKVFARMLLARMRIILLQRHSPHDAAHLMVNMSEHEREALSAIAKEPRSPINAAALVRIIDATEMIGRSSISTLPLELAVIELTTQGTS
jgi:DNA polymerase III subunit gamma/tau